MGLFLLQAHDQGLDLGRQLIGVAHRPTRTVGEGIEALLFVSVEDFVAGFPGDAELLAQIGHRLALDQAGHEDKTLFHSRTHFPWHPRLRQNGEKRYPCVRYETSPMSRVAHNKISEQSERRKSSASCHFCFGVELGHASPSLPKPADTSRCMEAAASPQFGAVTQGGAARLVASGRGGAGLAQVVENVEGWTDSAFVDHVDGERNAAGSFASGVGRA